MNSPEKDSLKYKTPRHQPEEELDEARMRSIWYAGAGLFLAIIAVFGAVALIFALFSAPTVPNPTSEPPPEPRLQDAPAVELQALRATESSRLEGYAWIDRKNGIVQIPIERSMDLLVAGDHSLGADLFQGTPSARGTQSPAGAGESVFLALDCDSCHMENSTEEAPTLRGLFGSQVDLQSGETTTADEAYLRESILSPGAKLVAGYEPAMPDFTDQLTEVNLDDLIAYIRSLGSD